MSKSALQPARSTPRARAEAASRASRRPWTTSRRSIRSSIRANDPILRALRAVGRPSALPHEEASGAPAAHIVDMLRAIDRRLHPRSSFTMAETEDERLALRRTIDFDGPAFRLAWTDRAGSHSVLVEERVVLGSADKASIVIADPTVSRLHAELDLRKDGLWIR